MLRHGWEEPESPYGNVQRNIRLLWRTRNHGRWNNSVRWHMHSCPRSVTQSQKSPSIALLLQACLTQTPKRDFPAKGQLLKPGRRPSFYSQPGMAPAATASVSRSRSVIAGWRCSDRCHEDLRQPMTPIVELGKLRTRVPEMYS